MLKLYSYFRSSASYRVRIGLHLKGLKFDYAPVHLIKDGGQQNHPEFRRVNPMGHVPALVHDGFTVSESMAILLYLDQVFPERPLFPTEARDRARVIQLCEFVNSGIQPLQNIKVTNALEASYGQSKADVSRWIKHWVENGLASLEKALEGTAGTYAFGGEPGAVDCFLVPQLFAARRFGVVVEQFPVIHRVDAAAVRLPAFRAAHPETQPDFQK